MDAFERVLRVEVKRRKEKGEAAYAKPAIPGRTVSNYAVSI